jgi:hypothetical protein
VDTRQQERVERLVDVVGAFARRTYPAVLEQHDGSSVSSALGIWLLLAACASAPVGDKAALEHVLGCSAGEAGDLLHAFVETPPPALAAALALWVRDADRTESFSEWCGRLPPAFETGPMPSKSRADAWTAERSLGLIGSFPVDISELTSAVLASVLATKVSWLEPFTVAEADRCIDPASPWYGQVGRMLVEYGPRAGGTMIVGTDAAGAVAVHTARAREQVMVLSVSAEPSTPRQAVLEAAHEVAALVGDRSSSAARMSLFDLPIGTGHSWTIEERKVSTETPGERVELIQSIALPAWRIDGGLDLTRSALFGADPALEVLREVVGPAVDDEMKALQVAMAAYTREGFEAAAVTVFGVTATSAAPGPPPAHTGLMRTADLRFDHPHAALAVASSGLDGETGYAGLPLFTAWVAEPCEVEERDPATPGPLSRPAPSVPPPNPPPMPPIPPPIPPPTPPPARGTSLGRAWDDESTVRGK